MATIKLILDKRRIKKDGTYPIKFYINHNRDFLISSSFTSKLDDWDSALGIFMKHVHGAKAKNMTLRSLLSKLEKEVYNLEINNNLLRTTDKQLKIILEKTLKGEERGRVGLFIQYIDEYITNKLNNKGTIELYTRTRDKIEQFDPLCTCDTMDKR